jgi:hypothetical protein
MMSLVVAAVVVVVAMVAMVATLTPPSDHFFQLLVGQFAALCQTSLLFTAEAVAIQHILPCACKIEFHWLFPFFDSTHL